MIPDQELVMRGLLGVEQEVHKGGWDQEPLLALLFRRDIPGVAGLLALPFPIQPQELSPDIGDSMEAIAEVMLWKAPPMPATGFKGFVGVAFLFEAWGNTIPEEERDGRALADIPGSRELRSVHAVDCAGHYYALMRERGKKAEWEVAGHPVADLKFTGRVTDALRDIMIALGRGAPLGTMDLDAIRRIGA